MNIGAKTSNDTDILHDQNFLVGYKTIMIQNGAECLENTQNAFGSFRNHFKYSK